MPRDRRSLGSRIARQGVRLAGAGQRIGAFPPVLPPTHQPPAFERETRATTGPTGRRRWQLWFPARTGPPRRVWEVIGGQRVPIERCRPELPPTKNDRLPWHLSRRWVKEWRDAACSEAYYVAQIPPLARIRVSGVVYRTQLGKADAMNDLDRLHPLVDGLQDAGVITSDTRRHVEHGTVTEEHAGKDGPGVLLIVDELEG